MPSSAQRRKSAPDYSWRRRRLAAVIAGLMVLGGMVAVTTFASAADNEAREDCERALKARTAAVLRQDAAQKKREQQQDEREARNEPEQNPNDQGQQGGQDQGGQDEGQQGGQDDQGQQGGNEKPGQEGDKGENGDKDQGNQPPAEEPAPEDTPTDEAPPPEVPLPPECEGQNKPKLDKNGFEVVGEDCEDFSKLEGHDGFQKGPRCVNTSMGEVASEDKAPTLLIVSAPTVVKRNQAFRIKINTRNLLRNRFFGAAAGGYYIEPGSLNNDGITQGHTHLACVKLNSRRTAPRPEEVPAFFKATEDNGGGVEPNTFTVEVPGLPQRGTHRCSVWAGDGSHKIPMMTRANMTPAIDVVRIFVR